jgi:hypothetical protein
MTKFAAAGLAIGLLFMGAPAPGALAASAGPACFADLKQLCPSQTGAALKQCRNANKANFSSACKQSLAAANMSVKDIKPERQ